MAYRVRPHRLRPAVCFGVGGDRNLGGSAALPNVLEKLFGCSTVGRRRRQMPQMGKSSRERAGVAPAKASLKPERPGPTKRLFCTAPLPCTGHAHHQWWYYCRSAGSAAEPPRCRAELSRSHLQGSSGGSRQGRGCCAAPRGGACLLACKAKRALAPIDTGRCLSPISSTPVGWPLLLPALPRLRPVQPAQPAPLAHHTLSLRSSS